jgi:hypothetical protein
MIGNAQVSATEDNDGDDPQAKSARVQIAFSVAGKGAWKLPLHCLPLARSLSAEYVLGSFRSLFGYDVLYLLTSLH